MPDNIGLLLITALIFGGSFFFQAIFGFGASLISVLTLSLIYPMTTAVAMVPLTMVLACALTVLTDLSALRRRAGVLVFAYSIPGIVAGALLLNRLNGQVVAILASSLILAFAAYSLVVGRMHTPRQLEIPISVFSGAVVMVSGLAALFVPVVMRRVREPRHLRVTLNLLWILLAAVRFPIYLSQGMIAGPQVITGLVALPAVLLALFLGRKVARKFTPDSFRRWALAFLTILAAVRLTTELV